MIGTMRDALTTPPADVLAAAPQRTAVLEAAGLVERNGDELIPHPSLRLGEGPTARSAGEAKLSSLRQAVAAAAHEGNDIAGPPRGMDRGGNQPGLPGPPAAGGRPVDRRP
ncbi:hypothetical protein GCM10018952_13560 [Streptosporangium vulgare]